MLLSAYFLNGLEDKNLSKAKVASVILFILLLPLLSLFTMSLAMPMAHAQGVDLDSLTMDFYCTCGCNYVLGVCETQMTCDVASSMKSEIRGLISKGMTRDEIIDTMTSKYGNTVLATPKAEGFNLALWWYPAAGGLVGLIVIMVVVRRRSNVNWRIDPDEVLALNEDELLKQIDLDQVNTESSVEKKYEDILKEKLTGGKTRGDKKEQKVDNTSNTSGRKTAKSYDDLLKEKRKKSMSKSKKEE